MHLPIHAAAPLGQDPFIHSYTSTLGTLLQAYEKLNVLEAAKGNTVKIIVIAPSVIADQNSMTFHMLLKKSKKPHLQLGQTELIFF